MKNSIEYFFAASNSFDGFVSYFDKIFSPLQFERIYILKGGPGTGKSRFIKDVLECFNREDIIANGILCSSDPKSFDGLILEKSGKKIAITDGTAPHATDPIYPGAIEKIINLGDFWNEVLLKNNIEKITELSNFKKIHYENAYHYLSIAKHCTDIAQKSVLGALKKEYQENFDFIFASISKGSGNVKIKLKSAFGKDGFVELDSFKENREKVIHVIGIYSSEYIFMDEIKRRLDTLSADYVMYPSPLDKNKVDAIFLESENIYITTDRKTKTENDTIIDTSKYIDTKKFDFMKNKLETLYKEREAMLWCATDEFKNAYQTHMELEKIYTASMNFKKNKKLVDKVCSEIKSILLPENSESDFNA